MRESNPKLQTWNSFTQLCMSILSVQNCHAIAILSFNCQLVLFPNFMFVTVSSIELPVYFYLS